MESSFGEYITKEYGLLKQVLSYLQPCDIRNAKLVCRDWSNAVDTMLEKNPTTLVFRQEGQESIKLDFPKPILPALVIHQNLPRSLTKNHLEKCDICKQSFILCPCKISHENTLFISLDSCYNHTVETGPLLYSFWQSFSAFILPSSPTIHVSTHFIASKSSTFKQSVTDDVVNCCVGGEEPIKCLIVISKAVVGFSKTKWIDLLINQLVQRQGMTFALGGGDIRDIVCKRGYDFTDDRWKRPGVILIALRGENITAHSDLLCRFGQEKIEKFMKEFRSRVGPLPKDGSRVAFITQCVDRASQQVEESEGSSFKKAFPEVLQFGFRAYGEYGVRSSSLGDVEYKETCKRMKMTFNHAHTTSLVVLTFNKI